ncbi:MULTISPECIES: hypothetical protein [Shewanella]|nr:MULTISPECIES: hypothetical protein [Shewanella]
MSNIAASRQYQLQMRVQQLAMSADAMNASTAVRLYEEINEDL